MDRQGEPRQVKVSRANIVERLDDSSGYVGEKGEMKEEEGRENMYSVVLLCRYTE